MYSNFKEQAIVYVKQAVEEDTAGNYAKAFSLYMNALEYFKTHLKYEKNPKLKEAITQKFTDYLRRAEEIRAVLEDGGGGGKPAGIGGDTGVATRPKTNKTDGGDGEDAEQTKLRSGLNSAIIREKPNVKWNDVAGLQSAKQALQEAVILPVKFPQFFVGKRRPWRAFLLYGPPGTGKSYLAKAVATEADSTFFSISSSDLVSKWMGESEKLVSNLFQMARESAPSIIFIDEIDSLVGQRGEGNESEASRRIKTELLVQMQGVGNDDRKVLVLAATNTPYSLDQAIRRRFDKRIYIPLPDVKARQHMFKVHLGDTPNSLNDLDFEQLAYKTEGFSGSDIAVCVLFEPVRKTQDAMFFIKTSDDTWVPCGPRQRGAIEITMQDLATQGEASKIFPLILSLLYTHLQLNDDTLSSIYVRLKIGSRRISNIFPVTLIQPESVPINLSDLKFFEYSAWQFVAIRLVCSVFMILLQLLGIYPLWFRCVFFVVLNLSFLSALYTVYVFYHAFYDDFRLRQHRTYFFFRLIIFTCFFQQALIMVVKETGLIQANLQNFLVIVEMLFLTLPSLFAFPPCQYASDMLPVVQPESSIY